MEIALTKGTKKGLNRLMTKYGCKDIPETITRLVRDAEVVNQTQNTNTPASETQSVRDLWNVLTLTERVQTLVKYMTRAFGLQRVFSLSSYASNKRTGYDNLYHAVVWVDNTENNMPYPNKSILDPSKCDFSNLDRSDFTENYKEWLTKNNSGIWQIKGFTIKIITEMHTERYSSTSREIAVGFKLISSERPNCSIEYVWNAEDKEFNIQISEPASKKKK